MNKSLNRGDSINIFDKKRDNIYLTANVTAGDVVLRYVLSPRPSEAVSRLPSKLSGLNPARRSRRSMVPVPPGR